MAVPNISPTTPSLQTIKYDITGMSCAFSTECFECTLPIISQPHQCVWLLKNTQLIMALLGYMYNNTVPIEGDLKGYLSGRSTRTFHTPPSYGAGRKNRKRHMTIQETIHISSSM